MLSHVSNLTLILIYGVSFSLFSTRQSEWNSGRRRERKSRGEEQSRVCVSVVRERGTKQGNERTRQVNEVGASYLHME